MFHAHAVKTVEIELSSKCNAKCVLCGRFSFENLSREVMTDFVEFPGSTLPQESLSTEDIRTILPPDFLTGLRKVILCGTHGDPVMARDLMETLAYLRETHPTLEIQMNTNGSIRNAQWWADVAQFFKEPGSHVIFALDGLEDTNALYRVGTRWNQIMDNVRAFIDMGGRAHWQMIVFQHNEHQVEEAKALAKAMGFEKFFAKPSERFSTDDERGLPVIDAKGETTHFIKPSTLSPVRNNVGQKTTFEHVQAIHCQSLAKSRVYLDFRGWVWPCSYTARDALVKKARSWTTVYEHLQAHPDVLDARVRPIADIIHGAFFRKIVDMWEDEPLRVCKRWCGK